MMKRTVTMALSAALLLGGTAASWSPMAAAQAAAGQYSAASIDKPKAGTVKEYGGTSVELESLEITEKGTAFAIVKKFPEGVKEDIANQVMWMKYVVMDDAGWIYAVGSMEEHSRLLEDKTSAWAFEALAEPLKKNAKKLIIKPYVGGDYESLSLAVSDTSNVTAKLNGTYPLKLDQGKIGKLEITGLKREKDKTLLQLTVAGSTAAIQQEGIRLVKDGKLLEPRSSKQVSVKKGVSRYELEFPAVDSKAKLSVLARRMTSVDFLKKVEFTVDVAAVKK